MKSWGFESWLMCLVLGTFMAIVVASIAGIGIAIWYGVTDRTEQSECRRRGGDVWRDDHGSWRCVGGAAERAQ